MTIQNRYYVEHRFLKIQGTILPDLIEWPSIKIEVLTADLANDQKFIFSLPSGMRKLEPFEFGFNKLTTPDSAHRYFNSWPIGIFDVRQVTLIGTDAEGDPLNPRSVICEWDFGLASHGTIEYPGGTKEAPISAKTKHVIMASSITYRDLVAA